MGRDYMDMPLLYIWLWLGGLLHLSFLSVFLKLVCYNYMHMYNVMYLHVHVHGNNVHATKIYNYTSYLSKADLFASIQPWRACWRQWVVGQAWTTHGEDLSWHWHWHSCCWKPSAEAGW